MEWIDALKSSSEYYLQESVRMIEKSLAQLSEEDLWDKPGPELNSVANLLLHLSGNIRQYVISSLGGQPDIRERDLEFSQTQGASKNQLLTDFRQTVQEAIGIIREATETELLRKREVQGLEQDGIGIVIHVVEHVSYHTGQIAFWVKYRKGIDLGFYEGRDLNTLNP